MVHYAVTGAICVARVTLSLSIYSQVLMLCTIASVEIP